MGKVRLPIMVEYPQGIANSLLEKHIWDPTDIPLGATIVVAAANSLNKQGAHYVCDGTNDEEEIQAAIDEVAAAGGGKVLLLEGTFNISSTIQLKTGVSLVGMGWATKIISDGFSGNNINIEQVSDVLIRDIYMDGGQPTTTGGYQQIRISNSSRVKLENLYLKDPPGWHITIGNNSSLVKVDGITFSSSDSLQDGVHIRASHDITVSNLQGQTGDDFIGITVTSAQPYDTYNINISDIQGTTINGSLLTIACDTADATNDIYSINCVNLVGMNNAVAGVKIDMDNNRTARDIKIKNLQVINPGQYGIRILGAGNVERLSISGLTIKNPGYQGIFVEASNSISDLQISDFTIEDTGTYASIVVIPPTNNITISNGIIRNSGTIEVRNASNLTLSKVTSINPQGVNTVFLGASGTQVTDSRIEECYLEASSTRTIQVYNADTVTIRDNILGTPAVNIVTGTNIVFENNKNYATKNSGQATFSGDGATTSFNIAHGLASTPSVVIVTPASEHARGDFHVEADATNITVTYASAPPAGTNNVVLYWYAEV